MQQGKALEAFSALANPARLDLVRLLMATGDTGMAAGEIGRSLGLSASRLSFHLSILEQAGLIRSRRQARNVFYAIDAGGMGRTIAYLINDCCCNHPGVMACCSNAPETDANSGPKKDQTSDAPTRLQLDPGIVNT